APSVARASNDELAHSRVLSALRCGCGAATAAALLNRRAPHGPVGAKYAAVTRPGTNERVAADAFVKVDTCVDRHEFRGCDPTGGARECGLQNQRLRHIRAPKVALELPGT